LSGQIGQMKITRHFITIGNRRVHYRKAGSGPTLLMVHQSPRSSAEYEPLMKKWGAHFTCIAPDSPGFGQSDALTGDPEIGDFSQALLEFLDAIGIEQTAAYGFHSGGIILVNAVRRAPSRFTVLAVGGYAIWTPEERAIFDKDYLPPFLPSAYGEHLTWVWNRILEQTWFFPWFDVRHQARIPSAHDDVSRVHAVILEMLDSGDAYRAGYGAVIRAPRDIPDGDEVTIPVLITAYNGDPLQAHIARLGKLPDNWRAEPVPTPADLEAASLAHIQSVTQPALPALREDADAGFIAVTSKGFDGLIHWQGPRDADTIILHAPGRAVELLDTSKALAIDLVGHGLSDDFAADAAPDWSAFVEATIASLKALGVTQPTTILGEGYSALLAAAVAQQMGAQSWGGIAAHIPAASRTAEYAAQAIPDLIPDRHGCYLNAAWNSLRSAHFFWPWYEAKAPNAIAFDPASVTPEALASEHRSLIRARSARSLLSALSSVDRDALLASAPPLSQWDQAEWATARDDIWKPTK
jgi:haloalkane dehalogenase